MKKNLSFFIAKRYFFSKNEANSVNLVSRISQFAIAIGAAALIIVLSVFNGFEALVLDMYNVMDPHIKISSNTGKTFDEKVVSDFLVSNENIEVFSKTLEEKVLLKYNSKEFIGIIKGVDSSYKILTNFDSLMIEGVYFEDYPQKNTTVVGRGVAYFLSINIGSLFDQINIFIPNREKNNLLNPESSFSQSNLAPVGVFGVQQEIDNQYLIADLSFVQDLINKESQVSSIDLKLHNSNMIDKVADEIQNKLGAKYLVQTRFQQQAFLYKIMNTEKLAVLLILIFILIISTFNMIGSLTMLITQKTNDLRHLQSIGLENEKIRNIFYYKGSFTIISGAFFGLFIGVLFAFLQYEFGLISMGEGSFVINSYPVLIKPLDVFLVFLTVTFIGILSTFFTVRTLLRKV